VYPADEDTVRQDQLDESIHGTYRCTYIGPQRLVRPVEQPRLPQPLPISVFSFQHVDEVQDSACQGNDLVLQRASRMKADVKADVGNDVGCRSPT
jgi:hypothetical protein